MPSAYKECYCLYAGMENGMGKYLIKNGHLIDPANGIDGKMDILIQGRTVCKVAENISEKDSSTEVIDASGKVIMPGFIDLHVHLREPGFVLKGQKMHLSIYCQ